MPPKTRRSLSDRVAALTAAASYAASAASATSSTSATTATTTSSTTNTDTLTLQTHPSPMLSSSDRAKEIQALDRQLKSILYGQIMPLLRSTTPRVSASQLFVNWGITVQHLDLRTGAPQHGQTYIRPLERDTVTGLLNRYRPWKDSTRDEDDFDYYDDYRPRQKGAMSESLGLNIFAMHYLELAASDMEDNILSQTRWRASRMDMPRFYHPGFPDYNWSSTTLLHYCAIEDTPKWYGVSTKPAPKSPHMICFIHDDAHLGSDGSVSTAELITIMILAYKTAHMARYRHVHVFPMTILSCSQRQVRIVQGCIDFGNMHFDIRRSDILDFNVGGLCRTPENKEKFITMLSWIIGHPVGDVKQPQERVAPRK